VHQVSMPGHERTFQGSLQLLQLLKKCLRLQCICQYSSQGECITLGASEVDTAVDLLLTGPVCRLTQPRVSKNTLYFPLQLFPSQHNHSISEQATVLCKQLCNCLKQLTAGVCRVLQSTQMTLQPQIYVPRVLLCFQSLLLC
jgi:hypothetical protein